MSDEIRSIYLATKEPWLSCGRHLSKLEDEAMLAKQGGISAAAIYHWIGRHIVKYAAAYEEGDESPELHDRIMAESFSAEEAVKEQQEQQRKMQEELKQ